MQKVEKNSSSEHLGGRGEKVKQIKHSNTYSISPLKITNLISSHRGKAGEAVGGGNIKAEVISFSMPIMFAVVKSTQVLRQTPMVKQLMKNSRR